MTGAPIQSGVDDGTDGADGAEGTDEPMVDRSTTQLAWRVVLAVTVAFQLVAIYLPRAPAGPEVSGLDKLVHLAIFAAPAFAGLAAGLPPRRLLPLLAVHAPVSELVQWLALPHRDGDVGDAVADLTGVAAGWSAYFYWRSLRR